MAEDKSGPSFDLQTAVLVLAIVGGAYLIPSALRSSRPAGSQTLQRTALGDQIVPARLWQDPFAVAAAFREKNRDKIHQPSGDAEAAKSARTNDSFFTTAEIAQQISRHGHPSFGLTAPVVVLEVVLSGGSYAEDAEQRYRARYAVLSALGVAGYAPWDAEHVGYAESAWPRGAALENCPSNEVSPLAATRAPGDSRLMLPYEWFVPSDIHNPRGAQDVLILWLNADAFGDHPARRLAQLNQQLADELKAGGDEKMVEQTHYKLINPSLGDMLAEPIDGGGISAPANVRVNSILAGMEIYSSWSTTADALLTTNTVGGRRNPVAADLKLHGWEGTLFNATCTDDELAEELIDELALRGTDVGQATDGVVLISESDTFYGRALPFTFAAAVRYRMKDSLDAASIVDLPALVVKLNQTNGTDPALEFIRGKLSRTIADDLNSQPLNRTDLAHRLATDFNRIISLGRAGAYRLEDATTNADLRQLITNSVVVSDGRLRHLNRVLLEQEFPGMIAQNTFAASVEVLKTNAAEWPSNLLRFTYLRGVDGLVPGQGAEAGTAPADDKDSKAAPVVRPEGGSQLDYLPRLAARLARLETRRKRQGDFSIKAIGVLGSDVYDKLLVLQALRRGFTGALFFTTDLDARLVHPESLKWTRNVIVVSSFGLRLSEGLQNETPPFRDTYQSGEYLACLAALKYPGAADRLATLAPRRYEIGSRGAVDLSLTGGGAYPDGTRFFALWSTMAKIVVVAMPLLFSIWLFTTEASHDAPQGVWRSIPHRKFSNPAVRNAQDMFVNAWRGKAVDSGDPLSLAEKWGFRCMVFLPVMGVMAFIGAMCWDHANRQGEPFALADGISLWPTEMIRVVAGWLALYFLCNSHFALKHNKHDLHDEYGLPLKSRPDETDHWTSKGLICLKYDEDGGIVERYRRMRWPVAAYGILAGLAILFFGDSFRPYRGWLSFNADRTVFVVCTGLQIVLLFFVVDASKGCRRLIKDLMAAPSAWPEQVCRRFHELTGVDRSYLDEYIDVKIIARRTEAVGKLILYPFVILFLMIIARASFFDRWDWPPSVIAVMGLNSGYAIYAVWSLRRQAEMARETACERLKGKLLRLLGGAEEGPTEQVRVLIDEIENCDEGAFAPVSQQPIVKALLLPFGGAGVTSLLSYLASQLG